MNRSLDPYSPRVRPLQYDALKNRRGCQTITGTQRFGLMPFSRICLGRAEDFTPTERIPYQKPRTVSYAAGPVTAGVLEAHKYTTRWAAWVASAGIRVGKFSSITPPADSSGEVSALFPTTKPTHLSLGFNRAGLMAIAIQADDTNITIKRFTDTGGTVATKEFSGTSPILWNDWLTYYDLDDPAGYDLVCYYLKSGAPGTLFARFERDGFTAEYTIHTGLPADIGYLLSADVFESFREQLLGIAPDGKYITFTSDQYFLHKTEVLADETSMDGGLYFLSVYDQDLSPANDDVSTLTVAMTGGSTAALYTQNLTALRNTGTLTVAMTGGEYNIA